VSPPRDDRQDDLFGPSLDQIINLRHPLVRLAAEIDWAFLAGRFDVAPDSYPVALRVWRLLKRSPKLGHLMLEFSGVKAHAGGGADEPFNSDIGA
jgi:hypothetical protein